MKYLINLSAVLIIAVLLVSCGNQESSLSSVMNAGFSNSDTVEAPMSFKLAEKTSNKKSSTNSTLIIGDCSFTSKVSSKDYTSIYVISRNGNEYLRSLGKITNQFSDDLPVYSKSHGKTSAAYKKYGSKSYYIYYCGTDNVKSKRVNLQE